MGIMGKVSLKSPTGSKPRSPLGGGRNVKGLKEAHKKTLAKAGMKPLRSPLK